MRSLGAAVGLLALLVAVPALLVHLGRVLPVEAGVIVGWARQPDDGGLLLLVLFGLAWAGWAALAASVAVELWASLRSVPTPRIPGLAGPQRIAATLVAALAMGAGTGLWTGPAAGKGLSEGGLPGSGVDASVVSHDDRLGAGHPGAGRTLASLVHVNAAGQDTPAAQSPDAVLDSLPEPARSGILPTPTESVAQAGGTRTDQGSTAADRRSPAAQEGQSITTRRHDTLWLLAEQHLGDGARYTEIVALNEDVPQPDGRALGRDGRIYPGWTLRLPADADIGTSRPERHRVVSGDTLWEIAEEHLGDPWRYPEVFRANRGDLQQDGRRLTDPDRIHPGWVLAMPESSDGDRQARPSEQPGIERGSGSGTERAGASVGPAGSTGGPEDSGPRDDDRDRVDSRHGGGGAGLSPLDRGPGRAGMSDEGPPLPSTGLPSTGPPSTGLPSAVVGSAGAPGAGPLIDRGGTGGGGSDTEPDAPSNTPGPGGPGPVATAPEAPTSETPAPEAPTSEALPPEAPTSEAHAPGDPGPGAQAPGAERGLSAEPHPGSEPVGDLDPDPEPAEDPRPGRTAPEAGILLPAGGTVASLLLAGLARELVRRRRQFQRHRRPGERMPASDAAAREIEGLARAAAGDPAADLLEAALAGLVRSAQEWESPLPRVRVVRVTATTIHLDLAQDVGAGALPPFSRSGVGRWELDRSLMDLSSADPEQPDGLAERPFPGLVTVGVRGEETVMVNLGEVGTLTIAGSPDQVPGVLRALVSEVALGPAHGLVSTTLCLSDLALSEAIAAALEAGDLMVDRDVTRVAGHVAGALGRDGGADPLEVVLADAPLPIVVPGRRGAALITTDAEAAAGARLEIDGAEAVLQPDGIRLVPQALAASAATHLAALLGTTHVPDDPVIDLREPLGDDPSRVPEPAEAPAAPHAAAPAAPHAAAPAAPRAAPPASASRPGTTPPDGDAAAGDGADCDPPAGDGNPRGPSDPPGEEAVTAPRILLLGEVRVEGATGRAESTRIGRLAETAAFVLLNPDSRPSELQSALWPGRRSNPQTCRQMISRTRTWLGRTDSGASYLMPFAETGGRLRLRAEVGSDWEQFQHLAGVGLADPEDIEHLTAALELVRGRPFGPVAAREIPWADLAINDMLCLITDVAHELALRHERAGRSRQARAAALRGLCVETEAEVLREIVSRTGAG